MVLLAFLVLVVELSVGRAAAVPVLAVLVGLNFDAGVRSAGFVGVNSVAVVGLSNFHAAINKVYIVRVLKADAVFVIFLENLSVF